MKDARLEIRISQDDKDTIRAIAKDNKCTVTELFDEFIISLIEAYRRDALMKRDDSGSSGTAGS